MRTVNVSLTEQLNAYVQHKLEQGSYASASEVVRAALREMQTRDEQAEELRAAIREGLASGKGRSLSEISVNTIAEKAGRRSAAASAR